MVEKYVFRSRAVKRKLIRKVEKGVKKKIKIAADFK